MFRTVRVWLMWPLLFLSGCIIGTWPTPEGQSDKNTEVPSVKPVATEPCDGRDNDADGSVDIGCKCNDDARGCIAVSGNMCGPGIQWCVGGVWQECSDVDEPLTSARSPAVVITSVAPSTLVQGGSEFITIEIEPVTACAGIAVDRVDVALTVRTPSMRIRGVALDDGVYPDRISKDGIFAAAFLNPFGPGVTAQLIAITATAVIERVEMTGSTSLPLEEP